MNFKNYISAFLLIVLASYLIAREVPKSLEEQDAQDSSLLEDKQIQVKSEQAKKLVLDAIDR